MARYLANAWVGLMLMGQVCKGQDCSQQTRCIDEYKVKLNASEDICFDGEIMFREVVNCVPKTSTCQVGLDELKGMCNEVKVGGCSDMECGALNQNRFAINDADDSGDVDFEPLNGVGHNHNQFNYSLQTTSGRDFIVQWKAGANAGARFAPVIADNRHIISVLMSDYVVSYTSHGQQNWKFKLLAPEGHYVTGRPVLGDNDDVFFGDSFGYLYRLRVSTGEIISSWNLNRKVVGSPLLTNSHVFIVSRGNVGEASTLHKISYADMEEGETPSEWQRSICENDPLRLDWVKGGLVLSKTGIVVLCHWQGTIENYSPTNGDLVWKTQLVPDGDDTKPKLLGTPVLDKNGDILLVTQIGLAKLAVTNGAKAWQNSIAEIIGSPAIESQDNAVYVATKTGEVRKFQVSNGKLITKGNTENGDVLTSGPVVDQVGNVLCPSLGKIYVFSSNRLVVKHVVEFGTQEEVVSEEPQVSQFGELFLTSNQNSLAQVSAFPSPSLAPTSNSPTTSGAPTPSPTALPTASPTFPDGGVRTVSPTTSNNDGNNKWPASAIAIVTILAIVDTGLGIMIAKKKRDANMQNAGTENVESDHLETGGASKQEAAAQEPVDPSASVSTA